MKKLLTLVLLLVLVNTFSEVNAQCSMCRRVAESNLESGEKRGRGLNSGILYLMSIPYVMAGVGGYIWWKNKKQS